MERLKQIVKQSGIVFSDTVLLLDHVLNHQVDTQLMNEIGRTFASIFREEGITKVVTVEASGIPPAFTAAANLGVPLVFARRKRPPGREEDWWSERAPSFTKGMVTDLLVHKQAIGPEDRILIVDDIIANGDAIRGLLRIIERSGAEVAGVGVVVEKAFQSGARSLREQGVRVESLVRILSLQNGVVTFAE